MRGIDTLYDRPAPPTRWLTRKELGLPDDKKLYVCPMAILKLFYWNVARYNWQM